MGFFYGLLVVIEGLLSLMLIAIIFMQKTKGGMGGTAFGGSAGEAIFGSRMGNVLTKATVILGAIFLLNTVLLTILTARQQGGGSVMDSVEVEAPAPQPVMPSGMPGEMPAPPAMPPADGPVDIPMPSDDSAAIPMDIPMGDPVEASAPEATPATPPAPTPAE
jgi:preprotein translocase subunit SecG